MRSIVQFQVVEETETGIILVALDSDGFLWRGWAALDAAFGTEPLKPQWKAIALPPDAEPFVERKDLFQRIEDDVRDRDKVQQRLDSLPGIGDEDREETD